MRITPPKDRLGAVEQGKPSVMPEHVSKSRVDALDGVVGGGPCAAVLLSHLHEGEQRAVPDELVQDAPGLAQTLVRVDPPAFFERVLPEKRLPLHAPCVVLQKPCGGAIGVSYIGELVGDAQKFDSRLQPRPERRASPHLRGDVEGAALDARLRPDGGRRLGKARRPVADGHLGSRDPEHERGPCRGAFRPGEMPGDDVPVCDRYEHDGFSAKPDPVQEDDVVHLAGEGRYRPYPPYPSGLPPKRGPADLEVGDRVLGEQPSQKRPERLCRVVVFANARCAALRAAPASRPCFGRSVALHLGTARATRRSVHSRFLFLDNFSVEKPSLTRPVKRKTDTLSETSGNWCGAISKAYFP